jgi:hypothetical protein
MADLTDEIAASAAQWVVEEGLEYGPAKRRALKALGLPPRTPLPNNDQVEVQVREYIELFCEWLARRFCGSTEHSQFLRGIGRGNWCSSVGQ